MASLLRSISIKIFGVAVALLVIMALAAIWSGALTEKVHLQLRTFNHALFPMAITMAEVHSAVIIEASSPPTGPNCAAEMRNRFANSNQLIDKALAFRREGARLAVLERNKLELARLEPMLEDLDYQHRRLGERAADCANGAAAIEDMRDQTREVRRAAAEITHEIETFVAEGALIVGENQQDAMRANFLLIGSAALVGLMLAWAVARGMTRPISRLQAGARAVQEGRLDHEVPVTSADEIGDVTRAFNAMIQELREKERIKTTFGQYVDPRVVAGLVDGGADRSTVGEKQIATLFFSDIAGFTPLAERLAPSTLVRLINAYFATMSARIRDRQGIIDKYIGDAIMAFWVPPFTEAADQARLACLAALDQLAALDAFRAEVPDLIGMRRDLPKIDIRIGIATGEVVVGSIGSEHGRSFTAMGDTVNFGSRLEGVNKVYGTRILIDATTRDMAGDAIEAREIDLVRVVGREEPLCIYEVVAERGELPAAQRTLFSAYAEGLAAYRTGDWTKARQAFDGALISVPGDPPALLMLARISMLEKAGPTDWDGIWQLDGK